MAKSCIHIEAVKITSEKHNRREVDYDYVRKDLTPLNESWEKESIASVRRRVEENYVKNTGQKMQKKAIPIREGVVLLNSSHTIQDLHKLRKILEERFGIKTFQMFIHRDEGHWKAKDWKQNLHAHMLFDWTDEKGKSIRLQRRDLSALQDVISEVLQMERGQSSDKKHLNAIEFKIQKKEELIRVQLEELETLRGKVKDLVHKQAEIEPLLESDLHIQDFEEGGLLSLLGAKKEINRDKVEQLLRAFSFQKKKSVQEQRKLEYKVKDLEESISRLERAKNNKIQGLEKKMNEAMEMNINLLTNKSYFNAIYTQMKKDIITKIKEVYKRELESNYNIDGRFKQELAKEQSFKSVIQKIYPNYPQETNDLIQEILEETKKSNEFIKIFLERTEQVRIQTQKNDQLTIHNEKKGTRR